MSESSPEAGIDEQELGPDPTLVADMGPALSPVSADQLAGGQDARPAAAEQPDGDEAQLAAESIDTADADQEVSG